MSVKPERIIDSFYTFVTTIFISFLMYKSFIFLLLFSQASYLFAQKPVYELVERISSGSSKLFLFEVIKSSGNVDFFEIDQKGKKIWIKGNNNISIATGLNWYLKYYANIQITWNNPRQELKNLPKVPKPERRSTSMMTRYYLNYCTFSYTMAFWDWNRWQQEIDFMAMHGINLPLAITGTSVVWRNTLMALGYSKEEATAFVASPAHQAWWLMNNLEGSDVPVPESYFIHEEKLAKQIIHQYRQWGIEPVFAGYAGMVPRNAGEKLGLKVQNPGFWGSYPRPAFLQPEDSRFAEIAKVYYRELTQLYGVANYYAIDPFHEGGSTAGVNLPVAGKAIYNAMKAVNPEAVWVIQSWQAAPYQAMIDEVPQSKILVLDLFSESRPQWGDTKSTWYRKNGFEQHDWVYCMLLNFGGNTGLFGKMNRVIDGYYLALQSPQAKHLKGVGVTAEGVENNPVMYELLYELPWRPEKFAKDQWVKDWVKARYGKTTTAMEEVWKILANTAYNAPYESTQEGTTESVLCARPALKINKVSSWATAKMYYDATTFEKILPLMLSVSDSLKDVNNFQYDLVDFTRQVVANKANQLLPKMAELFEKGESQEFLRFSEYFLYLILLQDRLTGTRKEFRVGTWVENALKISSNKNEDAYYKEIALRLITTWGNKFAANNGGLRDYSHREWNGMLADFYHLRWKYFFDQINTTGQIPTIDYFDMEDRWVRENHQYSSTPQGNPIEIAKEINQFLNTLK